MTDFDRTKALGLAASIMQAVQSHYRTRENADAMVWEATYALGIVIAVVLNGATEDQATSLNEMFRTALSEELAALEIEP